MIFFCVVVILLFLFHQSVPLVAQPDRAFQTMPRSQDAGFSSSLKPITVLKSLLFFQTERRYVTSDGPGQDAGDRVHHLDRDRVAHFRPEHRTKHGV